jgi:hypothetical protein
MPKRKIQIAIVAILVVMFLGGLIATFSRPSPVNVSVTFAGYTKVPWPIGFQNGGFQVTNASFSVSNAGVRKARLTFQDYQFDASNRTMIIRPSGLGILCVLKPGQATNLVIPVTLHINGLGPDYRWRLGLSSRNNWLAKVGQQPKWLQTAVIKVVPTRWIADSYRADVVSDWITNQEPMLRSLPTFNDAQP